MFNFNFNFQIGVTPRDTFILAALRRDSDHRRRGPRPRRRETEAPGAGRRGPVGTVPRRGRGRHRRRRPRGEVVRPCRRTGLLRRDGGREILARGLRRSRPRCVHGLFAAGAGEGGEVDRLLLA